MFFGIRSWVARGLFRIWRVPRMQSHRAAIRTANPEPAGRGACRSVHRNILLLAHVKSHETTNGRAWTIPYWPFIEVTGFHGFRFIRRDPIETGRDHTFASKYRVSANDPRRRGCERKMRLGKHRATAERPWDEERFYFSFSSVKLFM